MTMITQHCSSLSFACIPILFLRAPVPEGIFSQVDHVLSSFFKCLLAIYCMLVTVLTTGDTRQTKSLSLRNIVSFERQRFLYHWLKCTVVTAWTLHKCIFCHSGLSSQYICESSSVMMVQGKKMLG